MHPAREGLPRRPGKKIPGILQRLHSRLGEGGPLLVAAVHGTSQSGVGRLRRRGLHPKPAAKEVVAQIDGLELEAALLVGPAEPGVVVLLRKGGTPLVLIDNAVPGSGAISVISDNLAGSLAAVNHLLDLGHRNIAFIGGPHVADQPEAEVTTRSRSDRSFQW